MRIQGPALTLLLLLTPFALAQEQGDSKRTRVPIDMPGIDLDQLLQIVSTELNVRFLYDEKIQKRKTFLMSPQDIPKTELFGVLLSVLEMNNFTAVRTGPAEAEVWKVVPFTAPIANPVNKGRIPARSMDDLERIPSGDDLVTLVVRLKHVDARSAFIAIQSQASDPRMVQAIESAATVIVTDTANNIRRIGEIVRQWDRPGVEEGATSFRVEARLIEAPTDGLEETQDAGALLAALMERAGRDGVRVLYRWRGQVQEGCPVSSEQTAGRTAEDGAPVTVKLEMTASFATRGAAPGTVAPQPPSDRMPPERDLRPAPDGGIAVQLRLDLAEGREGGAPRAREVATLSGAQATWLVTMAGSGGVDSQTLLLFVRVEAVK